MDNGPANPYSHETIIFLNLDLPEKPMITKLNRYKAVVC